MDIRDIRDLFFGESIESRFRKYAVVDTVIEADSLGVKTANFNKDKINELAQAIFYAKREVLQRDVGNNHLVGRIFVLKEITLEKVTPVRIWYWHIATLGLTYVCLVLYDRYRANNILQARDFLLARYCGNMFYGHLSDQPMLDVLDDLDAESQQALLRCASEQGINLNRRNHSGRTLLMSAAIANFNRQSAGQALIRAGVDLNTKNDSGNTALMLAIEYGHLDLANSLIAAGADLNLKDDQGRTAFMFAAQHAHIELAQALLEAGADVNAQDNRGRSNLIRAITHGHHTLARDLIARGANIEHRDSAGQCPLLWAINHEAQEIIRDLIAAGVNVNAQDQGGHSMLTWAVSKNNQAILETLISVEADLNTQNRNGKTALMYAIEHGLPTMARMLIEAGADLTIQDYAGNTAQMLAEQRGDEATLNEIIYRGIDFNNLEVVKPLSNKVLLKRLCKQTDQTSELMSLLLRGSEEFGEGLLELLSNRNFSRKEALLLLDAIHLDQMPEHEALEQLRQQLALVSQLYGNEVHFRRRVIEDRPMQEIPISLHAITAELCSEAAFLASIPDELQDDEARVTKQDVIERLLHRFNDLDRNEFFDRYGNPFSTQQIQLMKLTLSNLVDCFHYKKQTLSAIDNEEERLRATNQYHNELRDVVIGLGIAFRHCSNRVSETVERFYWKYANRDQDEAAASQEAKTLENRVLKSLLHWREELFEASLNALQGDQHFVSTAKYLKEQFTESFGLRSSGLLELDHRYAAYAQRELLAPTRRYLKVAYCPHAILRHIDGLMVSNKGRFYKDYKKWHKNLCRQQGVEFDESSLWNAEYTHMSLDKLYLFTEQLGILRKEG